MSFPLRMLALLGASFSFVKVGTIGNGKFSSYVYVFTWFALEVAVVKDFMYFTFLL